MGVTCSIEDCLDPVNRKGYCQKHYMRQYRNGTAQLSGPRPKPCRTCGETFQPRYNRQVYCNSRCRLGAAECETCGGTFLVRDGASGKYCSRPCWYAVDRASKPCPVCGGLFKGSARTCSVACGQVLRRRSNPSPDRSCETCGGSMAGKKRTARFCSLGCAMAGVDDRKGAALPVGSRRRREDGYIEIKTESGRWMLEHRYAMERLLDRKLMRGETVHHRNGDRSNNTTNGPLVEFRSGNLELWTTSQPKGQRVEDKVEWAVELLNLYRPDLLADPKTT